jgi:hypothetical protein
VEILTLGINVRRVTTMKIIEPEVVKMPSGKFKVIIWGQWDLHIMDWNGCNYRYVVPRGQPRRGFDSPEQAEEWWTGLSRTTQSEEIARASEMEGTFMGDGTRYPSFVNALEKPTPQKTHYAKSRGI